MHTVIILTIGAWFTAHAAATSCPEPRLTTGEEVEGASEARDGYGYPEGTTIILQCSKEYIRKRSERICIDGNWLGPRLRCIKDTRCANPGQPTAGNRKGNTFFEGSSVSFTCNEGFRLEGRSEITCISGRKWSHPLPVCRRSLSCPDPGYRENTVRTHKKTFDVEGFGPGDSVTFTCNKGYLLDEFLTDDEIVCQKDGQWEVFSSGEGCQAVTCPTPELKDPNLFFLESKNSAFVYGDQLRFACNESYEVEGPLVAVCDEFGGWSPYFPECAVIKCPDLPNPENGRRIGNDFRINDTVSYMCDEGYTLRGSENRTCLPTRKWSGTTAICDRGIWDCPDPGIPTGATKEGMSYNVGDTVTYSCGKDFIHHGSKSRVCLKNGMWSGTETYCQYKKSYDDAESIGAKFVEKLDTLSMVSSANQIGARFRENITYSFNRSLGRSLDLRNKYGLSLFLLIDISGSIDQPSLDIAKEFLKAIVNKVGASNKIDGTRVYVITFNADTTELVSALDEQTPAAINAKIDALRSNETGGATNIASALGRVYFRIVAQDVRNDKSSKAVILLTDGKPNWNGNPVDQAMRLKNRSVDMYSIGIGREVNTEMLANIASPGQSARLASIDDLDTVTHLILNGSSVNSYEECGVGGLTDLPSDKDLESYQSAKDIKNWPWMAGLYTEKGTEENKLYEFTCGATLIRPQWLLTAAHCFGRKYLPEVKAAEFSIRMGSLDRVGDDPNADFIAFDVQKIVMHPNYTSDPHELHDIALIKLVDPLEALPTIRPICLPNDIIDYPGAPADADDWYKPGGWAVVTGWGTTDAYKDPVRNVKLSKSLKYINMRIQKDEVCTTKIPKGKVIKYENIFCAGDGKKRDACKGDSGGPLSVHVTTGDAAKRVFQVGVVSWGWGCKQDDRYGYYVRVEDYLPWIRGKVDEEEGEQE